MFLGREDVEDVFGSASKGRTVVIAYRKYGYRLRDITDFLGLHYCTP